MRSYSSASCSRSPPSSCSRSASVRSKLDRCRPLRSGPRSLAGSVCPSWRSQSRTASSSGSSLVMSGRIHSLETWAFQQTWAFRFWGFHFDIRYTYIYIYIHISCTRVRARAKTNTWEKSNRTTCVGKNMHFSSLVHWLTVHVGFARCMLRCCATRAKNQKEQRALDVYLSCVQPFVRKAGVEERKASQIRREAEMPS